MRNTLIGILLVLGIAGSTSAQESKGSPERAELARKGQQAFEDQKWEEAAAAYRALVKLDEKNGPAWRNLGFALHSLGKLDEALEAHLKAAEFPGTRPIGLYNAGCVHALKKDKDKAFEYLMKAADAGFGQLDNLTEDTDLTGLHDDPRWEKLVLAVKAAEGKRPSFQAFAQPGERKASRVVWFGARGAPAAALSFGAVAWKDKFAEQVKSKDFDNKRWRLGKDFWTTLDTSIPLTVGAATVPPGYYYLTLERKSSGDFVVAFNDADAVRKMKLDAFQADKTKGGIEAVLKHEPLTEAATKLDIALSLDHEDQTKGALTIKFGPNKLSVPVVYQLAEK